MEVKFMEKVQPIRNLDGLAKMKAILAKHNPRDYMLFVIGCNTALRVGDLLNLHVRDVLDKDYITIREEKTGKVRRFKLPNSVKAELAEYIQPFGLDDPLFPSRKGNNPLSTVQAWRIISTAAKEAGLEEIGTHSMHKSFAYHAYQKTHDVAVVQKVLNHSSPSITKRYLGIEEDEVVKALEGFEL
jgi:integrase